ncbi:MAG: response regulator [Erysipelotrichaceae bacterium]
MYKVLIVDDEKLIRITLKNIIDWEEHDCEIVGLAKDGEEAYNMFLELNPQIIITDLKMPKLDGLELIKKVKAVNKNVQVAVLSNYNDFDLVRTAMKFGAFDYLMKVTLEDEELIKTIEQMKAKCVRKDAELKVTQENMVNQLKQYLLLRQGGDVINQNEFLDVLMKDCPTYVDGDYQILYFRIDNINKVYEDKVMNREKLRRNMNDIICDNIPTMFDYKILFIKNHSGLIIFKTAEKKKIHSIANHLMKNIEQYLDLNMSITMSKILHSPEEFYEAYEQLLDMHEMRFYIGEQVLIEVEYFTSFNDLDRDNLYYHMKLIDKLRERDFEGVDNINRQLLAYMKEKYIRPKNVKDLYVFILNNIEGYESQKGLKNTYRFEHLKNRILVVETLKDLSTTLDGVFEAIESWLKDSSNSKYRKEIQDVINFVDCNIEKKITLTMISANVNMNESYLSRTFKSETGQNLIYYINEKKMRKAMELLSDSRMMVKEAAYQVGIEDQFYFNKVFKKFYNVSPTEFRKNLYKTKMNKD